MTSTHGANRRVTGKYLSIMDTSVTLERLLLDGVTLFDFRHSVYFTSIPSLSRMLLKTTSMA